MISSINFIWCKPIERYLTTRRNTTHIYHGLVHKAIWTNTYHTKGYMIPLGTFVALGVDHYLDQPCISISLFNRWYLQLTPQITIWSTHTLLLDHIKYIYTNRWSWCQILRYINIFMASILNPTYGVQSLVYGQTLPE